MKVTRTLQANVPGALGPICQAIGYLRADIWRRYGALGTVGKSASDIRKAISARDIYAGLGVDGTIRNETTKDVVNDILTYKAAAKLKVRQAIAAKTADPAERARLYTLLKADRWMDEPFLHRQMRKHFRHGVSHTANQFIVRSDKQASAVIDGQLVITIRVAPKYGDHITDSDGAAHGQAFGDVLTAYSDTGAKTGQLRNQLHALEKKHRKRGNQAKADRILTNNLGRKKLEARRVRTKQRLRTIAYQSAHSIVDKAALVVSEDLTSPIAQKQQWKRYNRRMSSWAKGVLAEALDSVCEQRDAEHVLVNGSYTSQMDSTTGLLEGTRRGDKFYRVTGDVLQADHNAALNVLARLADPEIKRYMPHRDVRRVLLSRSPAQLSVKGLELQAAMPINQVRINPNFIPEQLCSEF
jgi:hypothetical protein